MSSAHSPSRSRCSDEQPAQLRHHLRLAPAAQIGVDAQLQGLDPGFLEPAGRGADQGRVGNVSQGPAPLPQAESLAEQLGRPREVPGRQ